MSIQRSTTVAEAPTTRAPPPSTTQPNSGTTHSRCGVVDVRGGVDVITMCTAAHTDSSPRCSAGSAIAATVGPAPAGPMLARLQSQLQCGFKPGPGRMAANASRISATSVRAV